MPYAITAHELKERLERGENIFLLDVREPWEYCLARIEGAELIPLGTLPHSLEKLDRYAEIVVYCHHGMRSTDAVDFLLQQGFKTAKNLIGGIDAWSSQVDPSVPRY
ncbi:MAG: rhodanese-like domain-containing protein [Nitrospirota bacterium]